MRRNLLISLSLLLLLTFCSDNVQVASVDPGLTNMIDEEALNRGVSPCDDFYEFACGGWIEKTEIPAGKSRWYRSFSTIDEDNLATLHTLLKKHSSEQLDPAAETNARKLGDYFAACMDTESAEKATTTLLPTHLAQISGLSTKAEAYKHLATLHLYGLTGIFKFSADQDYEDATQVIGVADRPTQGLPDRDYYVSQDAKKVEIRAKYLGHVAKMLTLSGTDGALATTQATMILNFETALAQSMLTLQERRDPANVYHLINRKGLIESAPDFDWANYFIALGTPDVQAINVAEPRFFQTLNTQLNSISLEDLKTYLRWQFLHSSAEKLGKAFVDENFDFYGRVLQGQKSQQERWKKCVEATNSLGEALGESYVQIKFSPESKTISLEMIKTIREVISANFKTLDWMEDGTKTKAVDKLTKINPKIGYPEKWIDYSSLAVSRNSYLENSLKADVFETKRILDFIGKPVDKARWGMFPHTVNAYYNPSLNEIVFPAAILQPPFFNKNASLGSNYGAIGMVMGHEMTHGFDDEGRKFDGDGNLKTWWSQSDSEKFAVKTDCLVKQYDAYTVAGGVHLNGKLTLGENIADVGGLKLSWRAYKKASEGKAPAPAYSGFNEDQQFFLSHAQAWCAKATPEAQQLLAQTDPHSAAKYRVNGVVVNLPEFQKAFSCNAGAPMAPVNRCTVW